MYQRNCSTCRWAPVFRYCVEPTAPAGKVANDHVCTRYECYDPDPINPTPKEVVPLKVTFMNEECTIEWQQYAEGGVAMQLWCEDGPMGKATVCIPEYPLKDNQVIIKDYAENTGMLHALVEAGVVRDTGEVAPSGYVVGNVCDLLVKPE